jgi:hypothetical protein
MAQMNTYLVVEHVLKMSFKELSVVLFDRSDTQLSFILPHALTRSAAP